MIGGALLVAAATAAVGVAAALTIRRLPTVRVQLAALAATAVLLPLAAVLLSGWVMFHMGDDVKILAVVAVAASTAVAGGLLLAHSLVGRLEQIRATAARLAAGDFSVRAPEGGPAELAELAAAFNGMAADVERLFDARRELVAWASHDLRTPLANMQAMLEATEDGLVEAERYLPALREQIVTLSQLVDDLFELARIDANLLTLELRDAELSGLVDACLRGVEAEAEHRRIRLEARIGSPANALCAPQHIERVLLNLVTNALRHTPSDGAVAVVVEPGEGEVRISVEDTGEGLSADALRRMFERFWRGDPARSSRNAGLGLAIARGIVEAHGGRIWAESRETGGARVSFTLPAGPATARLA